MRATPFNALLAASAVLLSTSIPASAEDGVSADKIVFGQAAALDGAGLGLGPGHEIGLEAAFAEINKAGGVKGRKLELKSVDDGYEPTKSIEAVKKLLGGRQGLRDHRRGRHPDVRRHPADRNGGRRALHRCLYRRRVPARAATSRW